MAYRLPFIQFYPDDWLQDEVSGCSLAAQGLWLRMLLLMHVSERYGYLVLNSTPAPSDWIVRRVGALSLTEYEALLKELDSVGVPSRTQDGIIFSRRMVKDAERRQAEAQRKARERRKNVPSVRPMSGAMSGGCPEHNLIVSESHTLPPTPQGGKRERDGQSAKPKKGVMPRDPSRLKPDR